MDPAPTPNATAEPTPLGYRLNPVVLLPGLIASVLLLVDYTKQAPVFCTELGGGCSELRRSAIAHWSPIPVPAIGILGFSLLLVLGLLRGPLVRRLHAIAGLGSAIFAVGFFAYQIGKGHYCQFCLVADSTGLIAGLIGAFRLISAWDPPAALRGRLTRVGLVTAITGMIALIAFNKSIPIPPLVQQELDKTPKGKVLVLDFLDFECPYCRSAHEANAPFFQEHKDELRVVRYHVPLALHPHAEPAARAALCGKRFGHEDDIVERIFQLDPQELHNARFTKLAGELGIDRDAFSACLTERSLIQELDADRAAWKSIGAEGLPTVYVGAKRFVGLVDPQAVRAAFEEAKAR